LKGLKVEGKVTSILQSSTDNEQPVMV